MRLLQRLAVTAVTLVALACLAAPIVIGVLAGWLHGDSRPEAYVALALVYVVLVPAIMVGMIVTFDRLNFRYMPAESRRRLSKADRRRVEAGLKLFAGQQTRGEGSGRRRDRRRRGSGE